MVAKMTNKKQQRFTKELIKARLKYSSESKYNWLPDSLDAYQIVDAGVAVELDSQVRKTQRKIACKKGCYACCLNPTVPINRLELMVISWYMSEVTDDNIYDRVSRQLKCHKESTTCPFLLDKICSIYPVRPIACRMFYIYEEPCAEYEHVDETRPDDILHTNNIDVAWMVSQKLMPHLGITDKKLQREMFMDGYMFKNTRQMHTFDWNIFAEDTKKTRDVINKLNL